MNTLNYNPLDVEKGVIGAVLADSKLLPLVVGRLKPEHFQIRSFRLVWETLLKMHSKGSVIDLMTVIETMGYKVVQSIGGADVLIDAFDLVVAPDNVEEYANILEDRWRGRELARVLQETQKELGEKGFDAAYSKAQSALISLSAYGEKGGFSHMSDLVSDWFAKVESLRENPELRERNYLPTGLKAYDDRYGGLPVGMTILAGRPAMGKTGLGVNIALNVAKAGKSVLIFSLEMTQSQLITRMLSGMAKVDSRRLEQGRLEDVEIEPTLAAVAEASGLDIYLDESATELGQIIAQIEQWRLQHGRSPDLVVIDYLGLIRVQGLNGDNAEYRSAGRVADELATYFTKKLNSQLLMLCQLNRGVESRTDKRPIMADIRDSGKIEQAAARIDFVYRDAYYHPDTAEANTTELITAKNRFGEVGTTKLYFESETTTFRDLPPEQPWGQSIQNSVS